MNITVTCQTCNKLFEKQQSQKRWDNDFCSKECYHKSQYSYSEGDEIGHLKLLEREIQSSPFGKKRTVWNCQCCCGKIVQRRQDYLVDKQKKNKKPSCGCMTKLKVGSESDKWTGCGSLSGGYFSSIKNRADKKRIPFEINIEYAWQLFLDQNAKCKLSNIDIVLSKSRRHDTEQTASLDRIDSSQGYIIGNVQWVHKNINQMKSTFSEEEFILLCKAVATNHP